MVLDIVEKFMHAYKFKCQFLIAGPIDPRDPYGQACAGKMKYLSNKYPHNFWADPFLFFKDGELLTCACDFGMMPSAFEPGGIVQHEFFVANTPVLAFKTGGLKDSVFNYSKRTQKGNGFVFDDYNADALYMCFEQGWHLFQKKDHYHQLRKNAYDGAIDIRDQGISWNKEFYKLTNKIFVDSKIVNEKMTIILKHINESNQDRLIRKTSEDLIPDDIPLKYYNLLTGNFDKDFRRRHKF